MGNTEDLITGQLQAFNDSLDAMIWGAPSEAVAQGLPLTFERLKALHDYLKPERVTIAGEEHEIYGYDVHKEHCPEGVVVLTEKQNPNETARLGGKMVIINESLGKAFIFDPSDEILKS